ncbi:signal recognition particle-docking protein FtsY, partial [Vibrio anguillarum]|nr:signal recognition particle-docking protein FtsY [Vibrio anguillarum]
MTEKKKRGLLSWLGFGDEESSKSTSETEQVLEPSTLVEPVDAEQEQETTAVAQPIEEPHTALAEAEAE